MESIMYIPALINNFYT